MEQHPAVVREHAIRIEVCNDCNTSLLMGYCQKCKYSPSMQDRAIIFVCTSCNVELLVGKVCPLCGTIYKN
jgi:predicted RNA-binding protein with PUA domain